jgi:hypothetical protein
MAIYATFEDVKALYELPMPDDQQLRVEALLRQASARLTALVPSLPARVEAGTVDPDLPGGMVVEAVLRVYRNPSGVTQQSTGPFSRSLHATAARNEIYFDPEAIKVLLADVNTSPGIGTFTVGIPGPQGLTRALDGDPVGYYTPEQLRTLWGRW